jgi:hypothetical protein
MSDTPKFPHSRRGLLAILGAVAVAPAAVAVAPAFAAEADPVAAAIERLRVAIQTGDAATLDQLTHPQLTYGHSSGRKIQTKAEFIASLAGKENYRSLTFTDQSITVVGSNALVRHVWDGADILPNGETGRSYIAVLQVWLNDSGRWVLLARQSCKLA